MHISENTIEENKTLMNEILLQIQVQIRTQVRQKQKKL